MSGGIQDEIALVVNNLSRFSQAVELDLGSAYAGDDPDRDGRQVALSPRITHRPYSDHARASRLLLVAPREAVDVRAWNTVRDLQGFPRHVLVRDRCGTPARRRLPILQGESEVSTFSSAERILPAPSVDVVVADGGAHPLHPFLPLLGAHLQRLLHQFGELVDVEWVEEQGIAELAGPDPVKRLSSRTPSSSVRLATNSLATRFIPSCSELTTQKSASRCSGHHLHLVEVPLVVDHGPPARRAPSPVDAVRPGDRSRHRASGTKGTWPRVGTPTWKKLSRSRYSGYFSKKRSMARSRSGIPLV